MLVGGPHTGQPRWLVVEEKSAYNSGGRKKNQERRQRLRREGVQSMTALTDGKFSAGLNSEK